jgi:acyl carrier protein
MNIDQAKETVISVITQALQEAAIEDEIHVTEEMQLIGGESLLDSMGLVSVCLTLEDIADEHGFEFDWTSDTAMSKSRSMFRTVAALAEELANQSAT